MGWAAAIVLSERKILYYDTTLWIGNVCFGGNGNDVLWSLYVSVVGNAKSIETLIAKISTVKHDIKAKWSNRRYTLYGASLFTITTSKSHYTPQRFPRLPGRKLL